MKVSNFWLNLNNYLAPPLTRKKGNLIKAAFLIFTRGFLIDSEGHAAGERCILTLLLFYYAHHIFAASVDNGSHVDAGR